MDTVFINGVTIRTNTEKAIKFIASVYVIEISHEEYYRYLDLVMHRYKNSKFSIKTIYCDGKYKTIID